MKAKRICAETLIELAVSTLRRELQPALGPEHRFTAAMLVNALEIARREIACDSESPLWTLLDRVYDDGEGSVQQLARDIRSGKVAEGCHPGLEAALREILIAELRIANPRYLGGGARTAASQS